MEVGTVQSVLQGLVAATISAIVFAFSSLLVAIQVASAQLSPRIIATTLLRDNTIRLVVALFVMTLSFGLGTLARSQTQVQYLLLTCAMVLAGASTVAFIYLIDYAARLLRPVSIVWRLGAEALTVIEQVYPSKIKGKHIRSKPHPPLGTPDRIIAHQGVSAIILAVDLETLRLEAERTNGIIGFTRQVGDFLAVGEPLFLLYGGAAAAHDRVLRGAVDDALSTKVRWHAVVSYRTGFDPLTFEMFLTEIEDLHDWIELGPHWDTVELIEIRRVNYTDSAKLTLEPAEDLGNQPGETIRGHTARAAGKSAVAPA